MKEHRITTLSKGGIEYIKIEDVFDFNIEKTFDCGQCFRFAPVLHSQHEIEYATIAHGKLISIASDGNTLYIYNTNETEYRNIWRRYFGLDMDYSKTFDDILSRSEVPALASAIEAGRGIRILRQEPWEVICSFIISQNNNIPRIKKIISSLSVRLGKAIECYGMEGHGGSDALYSFATAKAIKEAGVGVLTELKTGFRAKYIIDAAERYCDGRLDVNYLNYCSDTGVCAEHLKTVKGIGDKVAACVLLFGFGKYDAFPIDVWMKRVILKYFDDCFEKTCLGPYAGIAQQYLFYFERWQGGEAGEAGVS